MSNLYQTVRTAENIFKRNYKFVPVRATKTYRGRRVTAPLILKVKLSGEIYVTSALALGKEPPPYILSRSLGGPQSVYARSVEDRT